MLPVMEATVVSPSDITFTEVTTEGESVLAT